jgi:hypothetical protein
MILLELCSRCSAYIPPNAGCVCGACGLPQVTFRIGNVEFFTRHVLSHFLEQGLPGLDPESHFKNWPSFRALGTSLQPKVGIPEGATAVWERLVSRGHIKPEARSIRSLTVINVVDAIRFVEEQLPMLQDEYYRALLALFRSSCISPGM